MPPFAIVGAVHLNRNENRWYPWLAPLLGLFRWRDQSPTDNRTRTAILEVIEANPGIILSEIKTSLGLHNGVTSYHLSLLEQSDLIRSAPAPLNRRARCFFPADWPHDEPPRRFTATQERVMHYLAENPGSSASEMARHLTPRYRRQSLVYTLQRLAEVGYVRRESGPSGSWLWYANESPPVRR